MTGKVRRFTGLSQELKELARRRDQISKEIMVKKQVAQLNPPSWVNDSMRLVYLSTEINSPAWEVRFQIVLFLIGSKFGKTLKEIRDGLSVYGAINDNTLRGHVNYLKKSGAIEKDRLQRWNINSTKLAEIANELSLDD
jgi:hypothetical protein